MGKYFAVIVCSLFFTVVKAQQFSYVYIQGDKETPFYVKYEDEMLPRFGKNYYIISELAPGAINIQVLFQQNMYAPQRFTINVPDNGFRGFLLTNKNGSFSLYDIHRQFYIPAGNKAADDNYEVYTAGTPTVPVDDITPLKQQAELTPAPPTAAIPPKPVAAKKPRPAVAKQPKPATSKTQTPKPKPAKPVSKSGEPVFLDVELRNNGSGGNTVPAGGVTRNKLAVINSDCPSAISNEAFDDFYNKAITRSSSGKLKLLLEKVGDNCYTSNQVRQLAQILVGDSERFTYLKKVYPRVTDQSAFERLENLLTSEEWKGYFRSMMQPQ